ncbi:ATP-binding protein [Streptomyces sp. NPDC001792]|uniref:ATP-binding protein n=1 Tax=Streptomyces sp. NPDC001792 TaxID=3154524 RepID=UPI0033248AA5
MIGRAADRDRLSRLLDDVRDGRSQALIVHGEAGVGKTTLLEYLLQQAADCQQVRVQAVESEVELAYAALHQLCTPMLPVLEQLPDPQRAAPQLAASADDPAPPPDRRRRTPRRSRADRPRG